MLLISVLALPGLFGLLTMGGPLAATGLDEASLTGALFLGEVGIELCLLTMVPVLVAKSLVQDHEEDPVSVHDGFRPEVAAFRAASAVVGTSAFLAVFFTLVHGSLLPSSFGSPAGARLALFTALAVQLVLPGTLAAEATRRFLAGPRVLCRAVGVRAAGAVPFLVLFPAFVWLPLLVHHHSVETLVRVGRFVGEGLVVLEPGVALVRSTAGGPATPMLGWSTVLAAGLLGSGWVLARWLFLGPEALCCPEGSPDPENRSRTLPLAPRAEGRRSLLALFLWKDVFVERLGRPSAYVGRHALLLAGTCLLATELAGAPAVLAASAGLSMTSLSALGGEGPTVTLLHPILRPARMFAVKWTVVWLEASAHLPFHILALIVVAAPGGATATTAAELLAMGLGAGLLFSLLGTGLGFLLPDPRRRSFLLPGASRTGQALYLFFVASLIAGFA
jgi:hypothetical protein